MMKDMKIILASTSPRRKELLGQIGISFEVMVSEADESVDPALEPWEVVEELSARKAMAVYDTCREKNVCVIGADTVVACEGKVLGKPADAKQACEMLYLLQNGEHSVYTGVTILMPDGVRRTFHEATKVYFAPMSREEILEYVNTGDPLDKAGAYGIQGFCARYIRGIQGDYNNVVGLPVGRLYQELSRMQKLSAPKKAVVFDLDGTLTDTISSMKFSGDTCMAKFGYGPFSEEDYKYFVGDGAANLVKRALRAAGDEELVHFEEALSDYKRIFAEHCMDGVKPYEGICELLQELKSRGIMTAVFSNKPHEEAVRVVHTIFGEDAFDCIQGQCDRFPVKPSPDGAFYILEQLQEKCGQKINPEDLLYLGDTGTDMKTGRSLGACTLGVLWGFRKREELEENGAHAIVEHPLQALEFCNCRG